MLRKMHMTRVRQKAWREMPEKMEAIRVIATQTASQRRSETDAALRELVSTWPQTMSPTQLKDSVTSDIGYTGLYSSLTYRFSRKLMLEFLADGLWHNLCHLPSKECTQQSSP